MEYEVIWSDRAKQSLRQINDYVAALNPTAADRLIKTITHRGEQLGTVPLIGRKPFPTDSPNVREVVSGKYRIFYEVNEDAKRVEILEIWHSSRQEPKL
jgi:toxin ParE1/3/4